MTWPVSDGVGYGKQAKSAKMARGKFDRLVSIWTPLDAERDSWNEPAQPRPGTVVEAWAAIKTAPGSERFQSAENLALAPMRFFFRWRKDLVKPTSLIYFDDKVFDVKSIEEVGRRELLQVGAIARIAAVVAAPTNGG